MVVRALWPLAKPYLIDRVLFWVAALMAANLIVRPIVILSLVGGFDNYDGFQHSIYWTTVQFSQAVVSVPAAITLLVQLAVGLIADILQQTASDPLSGPATLRRRHTGAPQALHFGRGV